MRGLSGPYGMHERQVSYAHRSAVTTGIFARYKSITAGMKEALKCADRDNVEIL